ncbi:MAG: hypothetical protein IK127_06965 [Clostridia bacterium]|nr:hypothetical protein [Clostridia bacterium]
MKKAYPVIFRYVKALPVFVVLLLLVSAAAAESDFEPCQESKTDPAGL